MGMDDWVQVWLGRKYSPGQARDAGGRWSSGRGYSGTARWDNLSGSTVARADPDGNIRVDKKRFSELTDQNKMHVLAHEIAHQTVEEYVLHNQDAWDKAEEALTIKVIKSGPYEGRRLFAGGLFSIGESVSESVAAVASDSRFGNMTDEQWGKVKNWARTTSKEAGYDLGKLKSSVGRLMSELAGS